MHGSFINILSSYPILGILKLKNRYNFINVKALMRYDSYLFYFLHLKISFMNKVIAYSQLASLAKNHQDNRTLPVKTDAIAIDLLELDKFITRAKNNMNCDAAKIYFIRYPLLSDQNHILTSGNNLSQISLAIVPAKFLEYQDWTAKDLKEEDGINIFTLLVCEPGEPRDKSDKQGICPPKPPTCQIWI